jgi:hypothetical protein
MLPERAGNPLVAFGPRKVRLCGCMPPWGSAWLAASNKRADASAGTHALHDLERYPARQNQEREKKEKAAENAERAAVRPFVHHRAFQAKKNPATHTSWGPRGGVFRGDS